MIFISLQCKRQDWDKDDVEDEGGSEDSEDDDIGKRPNPNSKVVMCNLPYHNE